jgi:hypothetical protein
MSTEHEMREALKRIADQLEVGAYDLNSDGPAAIQMIIHRLEAIREFALDMAADGRPGFSAYLAQIAKDKQASA